MPHSQANRLLNRINALHKSLQLDEGGSLSTMERDLMLGYLRELYEYYLNAAGQPATPPPPTPASPTVEKPAPRPAQATPPPPAKPAPPPPKPTPPASPPVEKSTPDVTPPPPPPPNPAPIPPTASAGSVSKEIAELFSQPGGSDLAARLGSQSLDDLTRALSINSRLLYTKALFGDDNDLLNTTLRTLNGSGSLQAARPVLESLAKRFDWTQEERRETALEFIDLVRRRYA